MTKMNAVGWFDIYVEDLDRAVAFYETVLGIVLPDSNPIYKHLSYLYISNWHFFNGINFESWSMEHFLNCSRLRLENTKSYHTIQSKVRLFLCFDILLLALSNLVTVIIHFVTIVI